MNSDATPDNTASIDAVLDLAKRKLDVQNAQISTLDSKAGFVFGSGSLLTAGIAAFQKGAFDAIDTLAGKHTEFAWWVQPTLSISVLCAVGIALALYLAIIRASYNAYKLRDYRSIAVTTKIRDRYIVKDPIETKLTFLDETVDAAEENAKIIEEKRDWTETAVSSLMVEAKVVVAIIAAQAVFLTLAQ